MNQLEEAEAALAQAERARDDQATIATADRVKLLRRDLNLKPYTRALPAKLSGLNVVCKPDPDLGLVGGVIVAVYRDSEIPQELRDAAAAILHEQFPDHPVSVVVVA